MTLPTFAMVSTDIRRDLIAPLREIRRFQLVHAYRQAPYGDLTAEDMDSSLVRYSTPAELRQVIERVRPALISNVEILSLRQQPYVRVITAYAQRHAVPLVAGVHISLPLRQHYGLPLALLLKLLLQPTLEATRQFFYLNEGGRNNLRWLGVPEKRMVRLMYGTWGIDPDEFTPLRDGREPRWEQPTILFVGRLHAEKGLFDLLEAFDLVRRDHPRVQLKLAGEGPHRAAAEAWVRQHDLSQAIEFLGAVKHRDLPPLFRAATLFTCPSQSHKKWEEYVGMTNIQAMACGLAVVSTQSGAIPEYVPPTAGILVPPAQPPALADALTRLLADAPLRLQMGQVGRAMAVAHYDAKQNVRRAEEYLSRL